MITREEADRVRDQLLQVLAEDARNTERLLARLDGISRESGVGAYSALLLILTHLSFDEVESRRHWEAILTHRRRLAETLRRDVGVRVALVDYFVNVNRRLVEPTLIDLELFDAAAAAGGRDPLTGLSDEQDFRASLHTELRRARRYEQRAAVALFDVDRFREVNESRGALLGDRLLREIGILLGNKIRDIDLASRPGEDEFALVLPETDAAGATLVAERCRREVESHFSRREVDGVPVALTVSAGVACYPEHARSAGDLLARAAQALYRAKATGKNSVQLYHPERRRFLRLTLEPGRYEVEVLDPLRGGPGRPRNLSRSGVLFLSPEPLAVGEEIEIRLAERAPAGRRTGPRIRGRVVRLEELPEPAPDESREGATDRYEVGMAFELGGAEEEQVLLDFFEGSVSGGERS